MDKELGMSMVKLGQDLSCNQVDLAKKDNAKTSLSQLLPVESQEKLKKCSIIFQN